MVELRIRSKHEHGQCCRFLHQQEDSARLSLNGHSSISMHPKEKTFRFSEVLLMPSPDQRPSKRRRMGWVGRPQWEEDGMVSDAKNGHWNN